MNDKESKLFEENQRLIYSFVNKLISQGFNIKSFETEDLYQTAALGMIKACQTFNPDLGVSFSTYSREIMKNELLMALRSISCKTRIADVISLDSLSEDVPDGLSPDYNSPRVESFEDTVIGMIDAEKMDLTDEDKLILDLKKYLTESEVERLCGISKWHQRKARMAARKAYKD
jgi:RNA polymerase sigma factor (sigma-70 family)